MADVIKFTPPEKAHVANAIDNYISLHQRNASQAKVEAVKAAHEQTVKELQALFIKVRQDL